MATSTLGTAGRYPIPRLEAWCIIVPTRRVGWGAAFPWHISVVPGSGSRGGSSFLAGFPPPPPPAPAHDCGAFFGVPTYPYLPALSAYCTEYLPYRVVLVPTLPTQGPLLPSHPVGIFFSSILYVFPPSPSIIILAATAVRVFVPRCPRILHPPSSCSCRSVLAGRAPLTRAVHSAQGSVSHCSDFHPRAYSTMLLAC